jgi:hypothetical protein
MSRRRDDAAGTMSVTESGALQLFRAAAMAKYKGPAQQALAPPLFLLLSIIVV